jgi:hypothetical protein
MLSKLVVTEVLAPIAAQRGQDGIGLLVRQLASPHQNAEADRLVPGN